MIHYPHIIMACAGELWAMQREKLEEISGFLMLKARGGDVSAEDLARVISQKQQREIAQSDGQVAVLPVYGTITQRMNMMSEFSGGTSTQVLAEEFRSALADTNVKAIVFDHNSPGGTVAGTGELAQEILDSRGAKPIIAQVNSLMASGSYWLGAMADEIVVSPGADAGSIGVYRIHEDVTKMLENAGVKPSIIRSEGSPYKVADSGLEPLSQDARDHIQQRVNQTYDRMVRSIAQGRGTTLTAVRDRFGQGKVFGAEELVSRGMADRIDTLEGTIERFGGGSFNPVAAANRAAQMASAQAWDVLYAKLSAGARPTRRELEHGLKGLAALAGKSLSNSQAEIAVGLLLKSDGHGVHAEKRTEQAISANDAAELRRGLADIRSILGMGTKSCQTGVSS
jgi:signal peptide peptidase SppA